ncbi:GNAT family N-acetyltransferase [Longitalea arenae]|uniref:GNAT family N-acetyltransferase n=1 Tax=Longitalea arenae TaxID=2812558 RepID=UPI0019685291|nr:GNAT family N-acetyltransferase [Longitalea arenae]
MSFDVNFDESKQNWDNFAVTSPHYSIFLNSKFLDSLNSPYKCITVYEDHKIAAGAVLFFDESGHPRLNNMVYTQFQGMILADQGAAPAHSKYHWELEVINFFIESLTARFKHFFLCQSWRFEDARAFLWHNYHSPDKGVFKCNLRYTGLLPLNELHSESAYLDAIRKLRKREYQKAQKAGYTIHESQDIQLLNHLHNLTFERQEITIGESEQKRLMSIAEAAISNRYGKILVCRSAAGEVTNATLFLYDARCGYYLIGANDPNFRNSGSSTFLMIKNIFDCKEMGLEYVDFVGINSPNRGDFKISFNAVPKSYFELSI